MTQEAGDIVKYIVAGVLLVTGLVMKALFDWLVSQYRARKVAAEMERFAGEWSGLFIDPSTGRPVVEAWSIEEDGRTTVKRENTVVFEGRCSVRNKRVYAVLEAIKTRGEEMVVLSFLRPPATQVRVEALHGLWIGENSSNCVVSGHGVLCRGAAKPEAIPGTIALAEKGGTFTLTYLPPTTAP